MAGYRSCVVGVAGPDERDVTSNVSWLGELARYSRFWERWQCVSSMGVGWLVLGRLRRIGFNKMSARSTMDTTYAMLKE